MINFEDRIWDSYVHHDQLKSLQIHYSSTANPGLFNYVLGVTDARNGERPKSLNWRYLKAYRYESTKGDTSALTLGSRLADGFFLSAGHMEVDAMIEDLTKAHDDGTLKDVMLALIQTLGTYYDGMDDATEYRDPGEDDTRYMQGYEREEA